jgi:hypothetical protein
MTGGNKFGPIQHPPGRIGMRMEPCMSPRADLNHSRVPARTRSQMLMGYYWIVKLCEGFSISEGLSEAGCHDDSQKYLTH